jgi:hypothetical protein
MISEIDKEILELFKFEEQEKALLALNEYSPGSKKKIIEKVASVPPEDLPLPLALFDNIAGNIDSFNIPDPQKYSVLIDDVSEVQMEGFGDALGYRRLSNTTTDVPYPVPGIIVGLGFRMFLSLSVRPLRREDGPKIIVNFLYDSASPSTFLRQDTFAALFPNSQPPRKVGFVIINEMPIEIFVGLSRKDFENIDLLGQDFFVTGGFRMVTDFSTRRFTVEENN